MPRRRLLSARTRRLVLIIAVLLLAAAGYVLGAAWWQSSSSRWVSFQELLIPRTIDVVTVAWLFWVGSSIGSFLNVVAWRMPRGMSINGRSRCPRCAAQLKWQDNFPVFGWLVLGGRCRACRLPISVRYPIVEAAVGLSITLVGFAHLHQWNLPLESSAANRGPLWQPTLDPAVVLTTVYHVVALSFAWAMGLILLDRHRLPRRLVAFALAVAIAPMLVYPALMIVPWQVSMPPDWQGDWLYIDAVLRVLTALAAAGVFGRSLARSLCPSADPKRDPLGKDTARLLDLIAVLSVPAVIVGWQALAAVLIVASMIAWALQLVLPRGRPDEPLPLTLSTEEPVERRQEDSQRDALGRFAVSIPAAIALQITCWRFLHHWIIWPSAGSPPAVILIAAAIALAIPLWLKDEKRLAASG